MGAKPPCCPQGLGCWYRAIARYQPSSIYSAAASRPALALWRLSCLMARWTSIRSCPRLPKQRGEMSTQFYNLPLRISASALFCSPGWHAAAPPSLAASPPWPPWWWVLPSSLCWNKTISLNSWRIFIYIIINQAWYLYCQSHQPK